MSLFEEFLKFLNENKIIYEFVTTTSSKTVEESSNFVPREKIIKTLIFVDINNNPFALIIRGLDKADFKKIKKFLNVKDVRLANEEEVLKYSGFNIGAVTPIFFKDIETILMDRKVLELKEVFAGGGKENLLIKLRVEDIIKFVNPKISDFSKDENR